MEDQVVGSITEDSLEVSELDDKEFLQELLSNVSVQEANGEDLSTEEIFPIVRNEPEVDANSCWERDSSYNIPSLKCSTVSDGKEELQNCEESDQVSKPSEGKHQKDEQKAQEIAPPVPPLFLPASSGLSALLHRTTTNFRRAQQQQQQDIQSHSHGQNLNAIFHPVVAPMNPVLFGNGYYPQIGYPVHVPLLFQPNYWYGNFDNVPSSTQTMQDLLQAQRAIYLDSIQNLPSSKYSTSTAMMNETNMTMPPKLIANTRTVLPCPSMVHHSTADQTVEVAALESQGSNNNKKKAAACCGKKKHVKISKSVRKLQLGHQRLRPMSTFNIFFKYERARIVGTPLEVDKIAATTKEDRRKRRKCPCNVIGFSDLGKLISQRWKQLSAKERAIYQEKARQDKARYEKEKAEAAAAAGKASSYQTPE